MKTLLTFIIIAFSSIISIGQSRDLPNFVFILTDDQPYGYMGCTGNEVVKTPNLDQLAQEGVLFTNAHITSAICTPSRASILLSQFERKHGINFNSGTSVDLDAWSNSYPVVMRKNGYYTGWIGKNHVPVGEGGYASEVMEKSFDYWYAGHVHLSFYPKDRHDIFQSAKSDTQAEVIAEGVDDFLSNKQKLGGAVKFLDNRPENQPFMLSVCFNLPHGAGTSTMQMREKDPEIYKSLYRDIDIPVPSHYISKEDIRVPKIPLDIHQAEDRQKGYDYVDTPETLRERYIRQLQAMTGIDQMVGKLRKKLKEDGIAKNTVIIFSSDHGLLMGQFGLGGKALCYEYTTHVPLIIMNPLDSKSNRKKETNALVQSIDIAPTMLNLARISIPETYQGKDLTKLLVQEQVDVREYLFTENLWSTQFGNPRCESVQNKEWKYIRYYKNENFSALKKIQTAKELGISPTAMLYKVHDPDIALYRSYIDAPLSKEQPEYEELYNLSSDPDEVTNLSDMAEMKEKLNEMRKVWSLKIVEARGVGKPGVLRYTSDSEYERTMTSKSK
ncbi:MAG: sulfatase-like hydrolase/transferase [Cyclobacteriaceae bacterium]